MPWLREAKRAYFHIVKMERNYLHNGIIHTSLCRIQGNCPLQLFLFFFFLLFEGKQEML